jgi:RNA polymerase sigma-70 factor (ECF subfamily)
MSAHTNTEPAGESTLLVRLATRDTGAIALLYDCHAPAVFGYAMRLLANVAMAELVVQDAFLSLWHQVPDLPAERMTIRGWLLGAVRDSAQARLRAAHIPITREVS